MVDMNAGAAINVRGIFVREKENFHDKAIEQRSIGALAKWGM